MDFQEAEKEVIKQLKASGLIERFQVDSAFETPNLDKIIELFKKPTKINADKFGLYIVNESDKSGKEYIPEMLVTISQKGEGLSDVLPDINFDVEQSGLIKNAEEAEAIYITTIVAHILQDSIFREDLMYVANNYNFRNMSPNDSIKGKTFVNLLNEWKNENSIIINIIISACKYRISSFKKDMESFLKDGLTDSEVAGLRELDVAVKRINQRFSQGKLSQREIQKLNKIERLELIHEKDVEISFKISNSPYGTLFRIMNLSTEYISAGKRKRYRSLLLRIT